MHAVVLVNRITETGDFLCTNIINGKPFLDYLVEFLLMQNIKTIHLISCNASKIANTNLHNFLSKFADNPKINIIKTNAVSTGGVLLEAISQIEKDAQNLLLLQGDVLLETDLALLMSKHIAEGLPVTSILKYTHNTAGSDVFEFGSTGQISKITKTPQNSKPSDQSGGGFIGTGIYAIKRSVIFDILTNLGDQLAEASFDDTVINVLAEGSMLGYIISHELYASAMGEANELGKILYDITSKKRCFRPWGFFEDLLEKENCRVKRLVVYPRQKLSLQFHHKREENWTVTKGIATVIVGNQEQELSVGKSVHIPLLEKHRLINNTSSNIEIIEVQTGTYFGEDDIVRLKDEYNRS